MVLLQRFNSPLRREVRSGIFRLPRIYRREWFGTLRVACRSPRSLHGEIDRWASGKCEDQMPSWSLVQRTHRCTPNPIQVTQKAHVICGPCHFGILQSYIDWQLGAQLLGIQQEPLAQKMGFDTQSYGEVDGLSKAEPKFGGTSPSARH